MQWIGADAYNFPAAPFRTPGELLNPAARFATAHAKPFLVGETASLGALAATPAWIRSFSAWAANHATVKAVNFFDSISLKGYDFRLIAHPDALAAFAALGQQANMGALP